MLALEPKNWAQNQKLEQILTFKPKFGQKIVFSGQVKKKNPHHQSHKTVVIKTR